MHTPPNGYSSGTTVGTIGFQQSRRRLFLRWEASALRVEQVRRWLCQPAVAPVTAIRGGTRRYLLSNVLGTVHVRVRHHLTVITDVQSALNTVRVTLPTTTRLRRSTPTVSSPNASATSTLQAKCSSHPPPVQTARTCWTLSTVERLTLGRVWCSQRMKPDQCSLRFAPFESQTRLY